VRVEPEQAVDELDEPIEYVVVAVRHAEAQALRMQRAIAHEVADELGQLG
jgi:hypothetical protein